MTGFRVEVRVRAEPGVLIAPAGLSTPEAAVRGTQVEGGAAQPVREATTGQTFLAITPTADHVRIVTEYGPGGAAYPEAMFTPRETRFSRAAEALVAEAQAVAGDGDPLEKARRIARDTARRFTYGHPEHRFNDGLDHVPSLGCGLTEGSCVDINTYFIAALRGAGVEAGYVTGYFFPAEKGDWCEDGHCWVVTRSGDAVACWDIAHHLKLGTREIEPGLNPKPGFRAAMAHSMGLDLPEFGVREAKLISEPVFVRDGAFHWPKEASFRLHQTAGAA